MALTYLALGSNLGDGPVMLRMALSMISVHVGRVLAQSDMIQSEPWGFESQHPFTNAVCAVRTELTPMQLLSVTQKIEYQMGRTHKHAPGEPYRDRIIDIDILTYDDLNIQTEELTIPHPHMKERDFVMTPLLQCQDRLAHQSRGRGRPRRTE